jgi:hypothetical protein
MPSRLDGGEQVVMVGRFVEFPGGRGFRGDNDQRSARTTQSGSVASHRAAGGSGEAVVIILVPDNDHRGTVLPGLRGGDGRHRLLQIGVSELDRAVVQPRFGIAAVRHFDRRGSARGHAMHVVTLIGADPDEVGKCFG